jgi:hypothetical protein
MLPLPINLILAKNDKICHRLSISPYKPFRVIVETFATAIACLRLREWLDPFPKLDEVVLNPHQASTAQFGVGSIVFGPAGRFAPDRIDSVMAPDPFHYSIVFSYVLLHLPSYGCPDLG